MFATPKAKKELFLASSLCDGVEDNNIKQVTTLLDNKEADPNVLIPIYGITPFHLAIGNPSESFAEEVTKLFLRHGGNPNIRSTEGLTPVHIAAAWGRCNVLDLLLSNGGDPLYLDNEGYNPFHFAFDGVHYDAVGILRKYCGDFTNDDEEIKYDMTLEKLLVNNKNMVAEYIVSDEQTTERFSLSPDNILEVNIKSQMSSGSSDFRMILNDDFITQRKKEKMVENKKEKKSSDENVSALTEKTSDDEKLIVSEIISHLSTSLSNDITITDDVNNTDSSLCEKRMRLIPTLSTSPYKKLNQAVKRRSGNLIRDRLNSIFQEESSSSKIVSSFRSDKRRTKSPLFKRDKTVNTLDHSIVSKSPNCNIIMRMEKRKAPEKYPLMCQDTTKSLKNSIISKSPNCGISSNSDRKRKLSKASKCGMNLTPKIVKKPFSKRISRTPCELTSKALFMSSSQKEAQISKSLPRNFQNKVPWEQESPLFKKPVNLDKKIYSGAKKKDTEESSGVYSGSSKITQLKNVAVKLEDCFSQDLDSVSNSSKIEENDKEEASISTDQFEEIDFNVSLENMVSDLSDSSSRNNFNSTENFRLKYEEDSDNSGYSKNLLDCQVKSKSNLSERLSENQDNDKISNNTTKGSKESFITEDLTERSSVTRQGNDSFVSIEEEYRYKDFEEGIILKERRLCVTPSCVMINKEELTSFYTCSTAESVSSLPQEMLLIDKQTLRRRLTELGENPGPITNSTHRVYLKRLMKLEEITKNRNNIPFVKNIADKIDPNSFSSRLLSLNWQKDFQSYKIWENKTFQEFERPDPSRKWREGLAKTCFNYLLLDSRITKDLPNRASNFSEQEKWETFLSAIFYIGKGKQSRPYAHLYDAFHLWVSNKSDTSNKKIQKILEIWNEKQGVVVLHLFHNTIPVEAYTREAVMIDALGVEKLANCKGGDYYGKVATWTNSEKCELGKYLLYKAMEILMVEGERHLSPEHL